MTHGLIRYSREDVLDFKNSNSQDFEIINYAILDEISRQAVNKSLTHKRTRRGCKAGRKHKRTVRVTKCINTPSKHQQRGKNVNALLPSLLYTNCRSLNEWKLSELAVLAELHHPQIICLTETWLTENKEQARQLVGYQNYFCHRKNRIGGGVGILVADNLPTSIISSHTTTTYSAIWTLTKIPKYDDIITGCIYHPPGCEIDETLDYISSALADICKKYPLAKFIIAGDFNHLPVEELFAQLDIYNLIDFNTRENAKLDLICTNISEYKPAVQLAPISTNDHCCVLIKSSSALKTPKYIRTNRRVITPERKSQVLGELARESWDAVYTADNVHDKAEALHSIINKILDKHCPYRARKIRRDRPPWMSTAIEKLIRARDKAFKNKCKSWKVLRALVQRRIRGSKRAFVKNKLNTN